MTLFKRFAFVILVIISLVSNLNAEISGYSLDELIMDADIIVVGKINNKNEGMAEVEILTKLKGNVVGKKLFYYAVPVGMEDVTEGTVGETAIYFFQFQNHDYLSIKERAQLHYNPTND